MKIRDGQIINTALRFSGSANCFSDWTNNLVIFLDTEILFHLRGYNNIIFKKLAEEFYDLISEINKKTKLINLFYFDEIKNEIDAFFSVAEKKITHNDSCYNETDAMTAILKKCRTRSDVINEKTDFYEFLKQKQIYLDTEQNYYSRQNHDYNLIDNDLLSTIEKDLNIDRVGKYEPLDISNKLELLNYIGIRRTGKIMTSLETCRAILLTGNSITQHIAKKYFKRNKDEIPFTIDIETLVSYFWLNLNKGLGNYNLSAFDITIRSQIILSKLIKDSLSDNYQDIEEKIRSKTITKEELTKQIAVLKSIPSCVDDIPKRDEIDCVLDFLENKDIEKQVEINSNNEFRLNEIGTSLQDEYNNIKDQLANNSLEIIDFISKNKEKRVFYKGRISRCLNIFAILIGVLISFFNNYGLDIEEIQLVKLWPLWLMILYFILERKIDWIQLKSKVLIVHIFNFLFYRKNKKVFAEIKKKRQESFKLYENLKQFENYLNIVE